MSRAMIWWKEEECQKLFDLFSLKSLGFKTISFALLLQWPFVLKVSRMMMNKAQSSFSIDLFTRLGLASPAQKWYRSLCIISQDPSLRAASPRDQQECRGWPLSQWQIQQPGQWQLPPWSEWLPPPPPCLACQESSGLWWSWNTKSWDFKFWNYDRD